VSRLRVLIIDDEPPVCEFLIELLTPDEIDASAINDPTAALEHLRSGASYHVLILDLKMPGMSGIELLEQLRKFNRELAVIIVTAFPSLDSATEAISLDVSAYMQKPFSGAEMRETIARVVRKKGITIRAEDTLHIAVGMRIRALREQKDISLAQIGQRSSLSVNLLSQIERAETSPSLSSLHKIAKALDIGVPALFYGLPSGTEPETNREAPPWAAPADRPRIGMRVGSPEWIEASLARLDELERQRAQHEAALETVKDPAALGRHTEAFTRLDTEIKSLYAQLEAVRDVGDEEADEDDIDEQIPGITEKDDELSDPHMVIVKPLDVEPETRKPVESVRYHDNPFDRGPSPSDGGGFDASAPVTGGVTFGDDKPAGGGAKWALIGMLVVAAVIGYFGWQRKQANTPVVAPNAGKADE
jgi:DNA-binding response OmpR family regulator